MKESLRKLQWCPERRTTIVYELGHGPPAREFVVAGNATHDPNHNGLQLEIGTCIGRNCAHWRWDASLVLDIVMPTQAATWERGADGSLVQVEPLPRPPNVDASFTWRPALGRWDKLNPVVDRDGHCGLSGDATYD